MQKTKGVKETETMESKGKGKRKSTEKPELPAKKSKFPNKKTTENSFNDNKQVSKFEKPTSKKVKSNSTPKGANGGASQDENNPKTATMKKYDKLLTKKDKISGIQDRGTAASTEKPNWMQLKKEKKELKEKRKAKRLNDTYSIAVKVKQIGEKLRRTDCTDAERKKLIDETHKLLQTHYGRLIFTHDVSRIIQWLYKYATVDIRTAIFSELKPCLVQVLQSKYAKRCVKVIVDHASQEIKNDIIDACYGSIVKLASSTVSAAVLEHIYVNATNHTNQIYFKQEFYGDMYKQAKDKEIKSLGDVFKTAADMKPATLSAVKGNLLRILNKKLLSFSLVHQVLWEFFSECSAEDRTEMIVMLRESLSELSRTKYGSKVAAICMWHATNKDKKIMMKGLKDKVKSVCVSEHGYRVLLALFDSVDDTVLVKKIILPEIEADLTEIAMNEHGRHVILYLVARRDPHYFPPEIVEYLQQGDNNDTSKKPGDVKAKELLPGILPSLLNAIIADTANWISNSCIAMVALAVLKAGSGDLLKQAFESIAKFITDPASKVVEQNKEFMAIEHAGLHMILKKLIQNTKALQESGDATFGEVLLNHITEDVLKTWTKCNRGCFLIVMLLENEAESTVNTLLTKLQPLAKSLQKVQGAGAKILIKKLK